MENNDKIINELKGYIDQKVDSLRSELNDFRRFIPLDSVKDIYSPITGSSKMIGFYGSPRVAKQSVTGSRGGNAALASLLTKLATLGLITDSSS